MAQGHQNAGAASNARPEWSTTLWTQVLFSDSMPLLARRLFPCSTFAGGVHFQR